MHDNSVENVVQAIFDECDKEKCNKVQVNEVIRYIAPFLQFNTCELLELEDALNGNGEESGIISRSLFMETMRNWTDKYRDCTGQLEESFEGMLPGRKSDINEKSFVHSTPRTSLGILNRDYPLIREPLNLTSTSCPDLQLNNTILEDRIKDLEYANWRLTDTMRRQKAQEQFCEDQIDCLKRELDLMTNKYTLAQKLIDNFNKKEVSKEDSTDVETDDENSQLDVEQKYKNLQRDLEISTAEFSKQIEQLEQEKMEVEKRNIDLETKIAILNRNMSTMEADIIEKNNIIEINKKEHEHLVNTNNGLNINVKESTTIIESFKSQQKMIEGKLRRSLCYNDKLQTSFNALKAVKAITKYSKSKQEENVPKEMEIENKPIKDLIRISSEVLFNPPFKSSKFSFYNINSPKIRKSPTKDKRSESMKEIPRDQQHDIRSSTSCDILNTSSPPVMYVINKTPTPKSINNSFDYSGISCEDAKYYNVDPRSPHMSLQTEIQEAILCCCIETKEDYQKQMSKLEEEIKRQILEKEKLQQEILEYIQELRQLENDKMRGVSSMRSLEIEIQSLKQKLRSKENMFTNDFSNIIYSNSTANQRRQRDTFDKLKMKLERYENLIEMKQDEINNVRVSIEVYKTRLVENDTLVSNLYKNNSSIAKLMKTISEDLQTEVRNFVEICQEDIAKSPKIMELFRSIIEEDPNDESLIELSTEVLDFSRRISCVIEILRSLAEVKLDLKEMISAFQSNSDVPPAVNMQSSRFKCDSPDSPSVNVQHSFNQENHENDCTVLAEADTKNISKLINVHGNKESNMGNSNPIGMEDFAMQTDVDRTIRTNQLLPCVGILLSIFYLLYECCTVQYRNDRTM